MNKSAIYAASCLQDPILHFYLLKLLRYGINNSQPAFYNLNWKITIECINHLSLYYGRFQHEPDSKIKPRQKLKRSVTKLELR
jgi:hypothetical protein